MYSLYLFLLLLAGHPCFAALEDILPRPQQMGTLAVSPLYVDGGLVLVMPDNPNAMEAIVRDEYVAVLTSTMGVPPVVSSFSNWNGVGPSLWLGTPERFPQLVDSLSASQLPGFGLLSHNEEYQILVRESTIFLAGKDQLGLQWGLFSLIKLMGPVYGNTTVDRVFVRDWPDFPKRICTVNGSVRIQEQYDYADSLFNWAYHCKMNEIEWNDADAGNADRRLFPRTASAELRERARRRSMLLTMSCDRTAYYVAEPQWQEGIPVDAMPMTVGSSGFTPASYGIVVSNPGFETWTSNVPNGWTMYPESSFGLLSRDNVTRHSGGASVKWANMSSSYPYDRMLHQTVNMGQHRLMKVKFWCKTQNYSGQMKLVVRGGRDNFNKFENVLISIPSTTDWMQLEVLFSIYDEDSASLRLGPDAYTSGTVWIDDVTIENAGLMNMLRRPDTPLAVYKEPGHILMAEGLDYAVTDLSSPGEENYLTEPRLSRLTGGALANGNSVNVDWYTAIEYQGGRETVCWSLLEPLEHYQSSVRVLDSTLAPDGFKIHVNEVSYAGYDPLCRSRGMTAGQLVGHYCNQMYEVIQARRPGAPVRIYGDPFDISVEDPRANPIEGPAWNSGGLQQLSPEIEVMMMADYTRYEDSSYVYINSNGNPAILSWHGSSSLLEPVNAMIAARRAPNNTGVIIFGWHLSHFSRMMEFSSLGWNFGPYFIHFPPVFSVRPDTIRLAAEMWTDSFGLSDPPTITAKSLTYRMLPGGTWTTVTPLPGAPREFVSNLIPTPTATSIEYYFSATDHRGQTRTTPPDAPSRVYRSDIPASQGNESVDWGRYKAGILPSIDGQMIEWEKVDGALGYEVHCAPAGDLSRRSQSLLSFVPAGQTRFLLDPGIFKMINPAEVRILPLLPVSAKE